MCAIHKFLNLWYLCYSSISRLIHSAMVVESRVLRIGVNTEECDPRVVTRESTFYLFIFFLNSLVLGSWLIFQYQSQFSSF